MALSDCTGCWETPCICGNSYKNYSKKDCVNLIKIILSKRKDKQEILKQVQHEIL